MAITQEQKDEIGELLIRLSEVLSDEETKEAFMSAENLATFDVPCVGIFNGKVVNGSTTFELTEERLAALAKILREARSPVGDMDSKSIYAIGLNVSLANTLNSNHIFRVGDLRQKSVRQLLSLKSMSKARVNEIVEKLETLGISLVY